MILFENVNLSNTGPVKDEKDNNIIFFFSNRKSREKTCGKLQEIKQKTERK